MTQEVDYSSLDQLFDNPRLASQSHPYTIESPMNEFGQFNDVIAIRSFLMSVNSALEANGVNAINLALGLFNASEKYPHLKSAIQAYSSKQYQATLFAANKALDLAQKDTSVNRNFAFCASCLLIAHANKFFGNDKAIVNALVQLKEHLFDEIGPYSEEWTQTIFDSFQPYWGDKRYQTAVKQFV